MATGSSEYIYEIARDDPTAEIKLFQIDLSPFGEAVYYYCSSKNILDASITWQGQAYTAIPIDFKEGVYSLDRPPERPTLSMTNLGNLFGSFAASYNDLVGAEVTIITTYARFLDAVNFPGSVNPDAANTGQQPEVYRISRKANENKIFIEFELGSPFEFNTRFPSRSVNPHRCIADYRDGDTCPYAGGPVTDVDGNFFSNAIFQSASAGAYNPATSYAANVWVTYEVKPKMDLGSGYVRTLVFVSLQSSNQGHDPLSSPTWWKQDVCVKSLEWPGCKAHFRNNYPLPFNGFPGINHLPRF